MPRFLRKIVAVEARQFTTNNEPGNREMNSIVEWLVSMGEKARHDGTDIYIEDSSGHEVRVSVGDWIVSEGGARLSFPMKSLIFDETFELCEHTWQPVDDSKWERCVLCGDSRFYEMPTFGDEVL